MVGIGIDIMLGVMIDNIHSGVAIGTVLGIALGAVWYLLGK